jgi:hypothetical protein
MSSVLALLRVAAAGAVMFLAGCAGARPTAPRASPDDVASRVYVGGRNCAAGPSQSLARDMPSSSDGVLRGLASVVRNEWVLAAEQWEQALQSQVLSRCREVGAS